MLRAHMLCGVPTRLAPGQSTPPTLGRELSHTCMARQAQLNKRRAVERILQEAPTNPAKFAACVCLKLRCAVAIRSMLGVDYKDQIDALDIGHELKVYLNYNQPYPARPPIAPHPPTPDPPTPDPPRLLTSLAAAQHPSGQSITHHRP